MSQERPIRLFAGPWSLEFERWSGWARAIRLGGHEVVRAVYAVVRGEQWETLSQRVVHTHVSQGEGKFEAVWRIELNELAFSWTGKLVCDGKTLEIEWAGRADQSFRTRRTGMCLLHPQELRGTECQVGHTDGRLESGAFPTMVDPNTPFRDIKTISHAVAGGKVEIEFAGEVFEMEDQRNWTDASFKTYCRPQEWNQPYELQSEDMVRHGVKLHSSGEILAVDRGCRTDLTRSGRFARLPRIGTRSENPDPRFSFVLHPEDENGWSSAGFGIVHAVAGRFADLNRNRPSMSGIEAVAFAANPQVHTRDERSMMENVQGLSGPVQTAREVFGERKVCVGPVKFGGKGSARDFPSDSRIAPVWFMASLAILAESGASAACYFEAGDFEGLLNEALALVPPGEVGEIELVHSADPYRAMGLGLPDGRAVLLNMRPYATSVFFGEEIELEPYEVCVLDSGPEAE